MPTNEEIGTIWEDNSPCSLENLSIKYILQNPGILFCAIDVTQKRRVSNEDGKQVPQIPPKLYEWKTLRPRSDSK